MRSKTHSVTTTASFCQFREAFQKLAYDSVRETFVNFGNSKKQYLQELVAINIDYEIVNRSIGPLEE